MCAKENNLEEKVKSLYEVMQEEKIEVLDIKSADMKVYIRRKNPNAQNIQVKGKVAPSQVNNLQVQDMPLEYLQLLQLILHIQIQL